MRLALLSALLTLLAATPALAGAGMWPFDGVPTARINRELGTAIDQAWLDRLRLASPRIAGCSSSMVSPEGLLLTNNHCVIGCTQKLSTPATDLVARGFAAATRAEERRCPGQTAEVLIGITDVTARVKTAVKGVAADRFTAARDAATAAIETEGCAADKALRCQVVSFHRGGAYKLYRYRRHTDVRLVFAPEHAAAAFGGDPDNFSFPRYGLDFGLLRIYEGGRPLATPGHLKVNVARPTSGEPVFIAGNPGTTSRLLTQAQLATLRDVQLPLDQLTLSELRGRLLRFRVESEANRFATADLLDGIENVYKRARGQQAALVDAAFMAGKAKEEADLRAAVRAKPALAREIGDPWSEVAAVQAPAAELYPAYLLLEQRAGWRSDLYGYARSLVRAAQERAKPSAERLPEYADARLPLLEKALLDAAPTRPEVDALLIGWWLDKARETLTPDDPRVRRLLSRESPEGLATRLVAGTKLGDPAVRRRLWDGGLAAVQASDDPLIRFVLATGEDARASRRAWETRVSGPVDRAAERLARARFAVYGDTVPPDATGTLRLSYGRIEPWMQEGRSIGPFTTWAGLWQRNTGAEPFAAAPKLLAARAKLNPDTVLDMVASTDTSGGSSGSPAVNSRGELIGANFDSTLLTQRNAFGYDARVNRSVIVSVGAIVEALDKAYGQKRLADEMLGR